MNYHLMPSKTLYYNIYIVCFRIFRKQKLVNNNSLEIIFVQCASSYKSNIGASRLFIFPNAFKGSRASRFDRMPNFMCSVGTVSQTFRDFFNHRYVILIQPQKPTLLTGALSVATLLAQSPNVLWDPPSSVSCVRPACDVSQFLLPRSSADWDGSNVVQIGRRVDSSGSGQLKFLRRRRSKRSRILQVRVLRVSRWAGSCWEVRSVTILPTHLWFSPEMHLMVAELAVLKK